MNSDLDLARAAAATYRCAAPLLPLPPTGVFCCPSTGPDGVPIVAFRGSVTLEDWVTDFTFRPITVATQPRLGRVHTGFIADALSVVDRVAAYVGGAPYDLTGHSLGGAQAVAVAALLLAAGKNPPRQVVTFGCPRVGMAEFVAFTAPLAIRQYRRGNDIVPEVPRDVPPEFAFLDTRAPIGIGAAQADFLACQHDEGYVADVAAFLSRKAA